MAIARQVRTEYLPTLPVVLHLLSLPQAAAANQIVPALIIMDFEECHFVAAVVFGLHAPASETFSSPPFATAW